MSERGQLVARYDGYVRQVKYLVKGETTVLEESGRADDGIFWSIGCLT